MKIKCIGTKRRDGYLYGSITVGKKYDVIKNSPGKYMIMNSAGVEYWYEGYLFVQVPEPAPDVKAELLAEAGKITSGARREAYGKPEDNFERIAEFWQAYFKNTGRADMNITAKDVSPLMRLMKEARLCESPDHRDSFVDIIGYTLTGAEINLR